MITKVVNVDLHLPIYERLTAKQGDIASRFILFHLLDGDTPFDLTGKSVRVYARKPDKTEIFNDLVINDKTKGYCTLELTSQCLAEAGIVKMELYISESGKVLTSIPFDLEVIKCINTVDSIVSTNEFTALTNGLASLLEYDNYKNEISEARKGYETVGKRLDDLDSKKANETDIYLKSIIDTMMENKMDKNSIIQVENLSQEIKEMFTGGNVAVVGENSINTINVVDKAITTAKRTQNGNFGYISCLSSPIEINTADRTVKIPSNAYINYGGMQGELLAETIYQWVNVTGCFVYYDTYNKIIVTTLSGTPHENYVLLGSIANNNKRVWLNCNNYKVDGKRVDFLENNIIDTNNVIDKSITFKKRTQIGSFGVINPIDKDKVTIKIKANNDIIITIPQYCYITFGIDKGYLITEGDYTVKASIGGWIYFDTVNKTIIILDGYTALPDEHYVLIGSVSISSGKAHLNCSNYEVITQKHAISHFTVPIEYNGQTYNDNGCLWLPSNYKSMGTPSRLVIFCHGSGEKIDTGTSTLPNPFQYLLKMGYAVLDMNGIPIEITGDGNGRHFNAPFALSSYTKGYQYAIDNFNLKKEVFITGMSLGGMMANQLVQSGSIPVIAAGLFCPVTDYFKQAWCRPWQTDQRKLIAKYFLMNNYDTFSFSSSGTPTSEEIEYFKDNVDKIIGYNPMIKNEMYWDDTYYQYPHSNENTDYLKLRKTYPVPIKIWHNLNDGTVLPIYSEYFIKSVKKAGGIAELKNFETGGHNAWDNGEYRSLTDIDGSEFTLKQSGYELIKWFKRFDK